MKTERVNEADPLLSKVLREWQVVEQLPPRFGEQVWQRIARTETEAPGVFWTGLLERLARALARPRLAASYIALLLLAGLVTGYWHARVDEVQTAEQLRAGYVSMMDPYRMPHP